MPARRLPALQFYPADWRKDPGVQSLSFEQRGHWFELLMIMHEADPRGYLAFGDRPMRSPDVAQLLGIPTAKAKQTLSKLKAKGVVGVDEKGRFFNRRMVRDEEIRTARAVAGAKGGSKPKANQEAKPGSSSSSSSSPSYSTATSKEERETPSLGPIRSAPENEAARWVIDALGCPQGEPAVAKQLLAASLRSGLPLKDIITRAKAEAEKYRGLNIWAFTEGEWPADKKQETDEEANKRRGAALKKKMGAL